MSDRIDSILRELQNGFSDTDCRHAIQDLLALWKETIGTITVVEPMIPQAVRFESRIPLPLRGLNEPPIAVLGDNTLEMRDAVTQIVNRTGSGRAIGILVCATDSAFQYLRITNAVPPGRCIVLSRDDLRLAFSDPKPLIRLRQYIRNQVPFQRLIPFSVSELAHGSMFVGRKDELQKLIHENQDYALCGAGGMGKSSLLSQAKWILRQMRDPRHSRIVEVDLIACPADLDEAARTIAKRVVPSKFAHELTVMDLDRFLRRTKASDARFDNGPIDLFIDEADSILEVDSRKTGVGGNRYPLMRALRHARHVGAIRLTLSGRNGARRLLDDSANPFAVDAEPGQVRSRIKLTELKPLSRREAEDLLLTPLDALGCLDEKLRRRCMSKLGDCRGIPFQIQNIGLDIANAAASEAS